MISDGTLSIDLASLHESMGIVSCCCDVSAHARLPQGRTQCKLIEWQVTDWGIRSIHLNRLVRARDSDLIEFLQLCRELATLTCTVRSREEQALEACVGALLDTDCWSLCKVVIQLTWTAGSQGGATARKTAATIDGLFYPVGKSRALLVVDYGGGNPPGKPR